MEKNPNPFNPNAVVSPNLFAGRTSQLTKIFKKLVLVKNGTPSSFIFVGDRGIGKTALAKLTRYIATDHNPDLYDLNFLASYYSVDKGQTAGDVLQASLNELTDKMSPGVLSKLQGHLGNLFQSGKFSIGAFGSSVEIGGANRKLETTIRDQMISILTNIISAIRDDEESPKDGVLIVIDELNNLADLEECAQLIRGIVTTLDIKDLGYISFVLIGYKDTEKKFFEGDESARRNIDEILLNPMPEEEAYEILCKGLKQAEVKWDEEEAREAIKKTAGYPYAVQLMGHNAYEADTDGVIDSEDWRKATYATALELQSKEFSTMYSFHGKRGSREDIIDCVVENNACLTKADLDRQSSKNIYREVPKLIEQGSLIEDQDGYVCISSQLFRLAVRFSQIDRERIGESE
jgi:Cdc6-like AAA superfamily ATPase